MDAVFISGLTALAGSAIGGLASIAGTWMAYRHQDERERINSNITRRERIFSEFIDQASHTFADALAARRFDNPSELVPVYATIGKLRLFASPGTVEAADEVMERILNAYFTPPVAFDDRASLDKTSYDILRQFISHCQRDLGSSVR